MKKICTHVMTAAIAVLALAGAVPCASAQTARNYPDRPIRLIVPYPPGGTADLMARIMGQKLTEQWDKTVVVDNRGGAGGNIATEIAARAEPGGYTLLLCNAPVLAINPTLYGKVPFDPVKDFAPVSPIAEVPLFLLVHPSIPAKSITEFVSFVKSKHGDINYASGSIGSTTQLAAELFKAMAKVQMTHIPYKGSGPALAAVAAGQVRIMFELMPTAMPFVKSGRLRALAVTSAKRSPLMPELPTIAESGLPGYVVASWFGIAAPAGTPKAVVTKLGAAITAIVKAPDMQKRLANLGAQPLVMNPAQFGTFIKSEIVKWSKVVKDSGARID